MRHDLVAERLPVTNRLSQFGFATTLRFDRKDLRITAVVAAAVPADQTELGSLDPLTMKLVKYVTQPGEVAEDSHGRLVLQRLLLDLVRHRLHSKPYPHLQRLRRIGQRRRSIGSLKQWPMLRWERLYSR